MSTQTITNPYTRTVDDVEIPVAGTYVIDPSHSHIGFAVRHLMISKVKGRFASFSGTVTVADDPLASAVEVEIDTASIDTRDEQRDGHLRSPDFFDVAQFPTATYRSTGVRQQGGRWAVDGELTISGVTRPVTLDLTVDGVGGDPWGGTRVGFAARAEVDREDFGLTWNQALETGGVLVGKTITVEIEAEAVRQ
jgi:polyisoprenoid-binding protein YceI